MGFAVDDIKQLPTVSKGWRRNPRLTNTVPEKTATAKMAAS
jgi:hypothetical protein